MATPTTAPTRRASIARGLRLLRWRLRRVRAGLRHGPGRLARAPVLFGNSFPKSGTHLLTQVLSAFPRLGPAVPRGMGPVLTFERETGRRRSESALIRDLQRLGPGDISFGHVVATPGTQALLCDEGVAHFFLYRDPRDIAVSHAFYVTEKATDHVHHEHYRRTLETFDERLETSILGRSELGDGFPDIGARFALYRDWLRCPWVCRLRFEDFITEREATLEGMLAHARARGFPLQVPQAQAVAALAEAIDPKRSPTFRSGRIGGWKRHFTAHHRRIFKEVAGELLIELGYERDLNW